MAPVQPPVQLPVQLWFQLWFQLLLLLLVSRAASAPPPRHLPPCQVVQMDVICRDLSLRGAPLNLPPDVQRLDLSRNQVQNLTQESLGFHTSFHHLDLHANKILFIQPGLFRDMSELRVLDLSKNHLNVFALSKLHIGRLTAVESLDLSSNGLYTGMSDYFLSDSPSLANLSLNSNSITKIAHNTFSGSLFLKKISLHNNVILEIEDGAFDILHHLTELDLSKNSITCIDDFNLYNLKVLNLNRNSIEIFQSTQSQSVSQLRSLDLSQNKMLYFPHISENNMLEFLNISRNQLQTVNVSGSQGQQSNLTFNHLRCLDMSHNQLSSIPEHQFFKCMTSLEVLNVSHNCIRSFSITHEGLLRTVRVINLSYNSLQSLAFGAGALRSLRRLYLHGNALTALDPQLFQRLSSLRYLHLEQNSVRVCGSEEPQCGPGPVLSQQEAPPGCVCFSRAHKLHSLYLSDNNLLTLPEKAFVDSPLKVLDLSLNPGLDMHKDSLSGLEHSLVHLLLSENKISSLTADLSSLRSLRHVDLSTNQLRALPEWSGQSSIESLNLQNNSLVSLDRRSLLALERSLKTLYMGSNPLSCCHSLAALHMVQHSGVVVPDIEAVTCVHQEHPEPVNIEKVTQDMCHGAGVPNYAVVIVTLLVLLILLGLLVKCVHLRRKRHSRSFTA